ESWTTAPLEELAKKYDTVENHGWYDNLEPTLDALQAYISANALVVDYSGGTGILLDRLFRRQPNIGGRYIIVDASPKFLRLAVEKLGADERVAFRMLPYLKEQRRLQLLDEVLPASVLHEGADIICSTNAIHLYYDLEDTLRSWHRSMKVGA